MHLPRLALSNVLLLEPTFGGCPLFCPEAASKPEVPFFMLRYDPQTKRRRAPAQKCGCRTHCLAIPGSASTIQPKDLKQANKEPPLTRFLGELGDSSMMACKHTAKGRQPRKAASCADKSLLPCPASAKNAIGITRITKALTKALIESPFCTQPPPHTP